MAKNVWSSNPVGDEAREGGRLAHRHGRGWCASKADTTAGHTLVIGGKKTVLHLVPSGILRTV